MDSNPFEIPPLMSSSMGSSKGIVASGKENSVRSTIEKNEKNGTTSPKSLSSLQQATKYSRHNRLPNDTKKPYISSSQSPNWNGKFSSSLSSSPSIPPSQAPSKRKLGSGSKLLSHSSNSSNRPLRSLKQSAQSRRTHNSSPHSRLSPPLLSSSTVGPILPHSSSTNNHPIPSSASKLDGTAVLRNGETVNGFFCINHDSSEEYIQLVESLVDGTKADDPTTWLKVLDMATNQDRAAITPLYLVRMHRRATMRFRLEPQELADLSNERQRQDVLKMWLSNAQAYVLAGNVTEARNTYQHIENKAKILQDMVGLGGSRVVALFYLAFAAFELDLGRDGNRAKELLIRGTEVTMDPDGKLQQYLTTVGDISGNETLRQHDTPKAIEKSYLESVRTPLTNSRKPESPKSTQKFRSSLLEPSLQTVDRSTTKRSFESTVKLSPKKDCARSTPSRSPKRLKSSPKQQNDQDSGNVKRTENAVNFNSHGSPIPPMRKIVSIRSPKSTANQSIETRAIAGIPVAVVTASETSLATGKPPAPSAKKRSSLTSRLVRKGLSGAPKRVEADQSMALDNEEFSSDDSDAGSVSGEDTKVPSFKNMDLSYIWDWKPKGVVIHDQTGGAMGTVQATQSSGDPSDDSGAASKLKENDELKRKEKEAHKHPPKQEEKEMPVQQGLNKEVASSVKVAPLDESEVRKQQLMEKANLDFLPLVHEDNILRVNKHSYVKLGAIGKGGSCKVYRALSKKCSVVAIKKVKLDGMDKKQIEGYANEISLLKRLRGNPAIIQMYDSELDLRRKSLFVVMELGEVDLNYVLHQRAQAKTSKSLDMNFIRLTWQQMLSAVHCIHQEKIIHSDLKPANFLFVRGALKLIDFGIAKAIANPEDTTKIIRESQIGTLNYMSPESIMDTGEGEGAGPRMKIGRASDVWSLGIILYEMLYGKTPFAQYHFIVKLQAIINEDHQITYPDAGDSAEPAIDAIKQCLRRRPEKRPPIVGENGLLNEHWFLHSNRRQGR
ncbi:serine/threonine protein kinase [Nitzschia inconspicua]|uniref:Serine/threonine protein kinase n=1 Tax=Nitzschia inconspicua TaxID=303405 RepID=A0A9K3KC96_9STRA|nr:serine/threonine protein kinase [Nitzschia inconspicua]